jgi:hypothetical protein
MKYKVFLPMFEAQQVEGIGSQPDTVTDDTCLKTQRVNYDIHAHVLRRMTVVTNCTACLKIVQCSSKIQAGTHIAIIPTCAADQQGQQSESPAHIINLHLLTPLLQEKLLKDFSTEFTFSNPI